MWEGLRGRFTEEELATLDRATVGDLLAPVGSPSVVPEPLRAKFMAAVISGMHATPLLDGLNIYTDPTPPGKEANPRGDLE
jgi:hypothetical protein